MSITKGSFPQIVRTLKLVRATVWDWHGAKAKMRDGTFVELDSELHIQAIDASLKELGELDDQLPLPTSGGHGQPTDG